LARKFRRYRDLSQPAGVIINMRRWLITLVCGCGFVPAVSASILDFLLPKHDINVITVTDTTPVGALLRQPSPERPVYYTAINAGYRDLGGIIAGEKIPNRDAVVKTITTVLAKRGYLPATQAHAPSLLLIWMWGTMNTDRFYDGSTDNPDGVQINRRQLLRFMGAYKVGLVAKEPNGFDPDSLMPGLFSHGADADAIADAATDDLYVAAISAYDFGAATKKQKVLLWTTKISCPSRGLMLPEALPVMLAIAGPNIGRETPKPVWISASDKFKPEVKIGNPEVVEYLDSKNLPIVDASDAAMKKKPAPKK
jgi:hypothetical protein